MRWGVWAGDARALLFSRRAAYSIIIMAMLALLVAIIVRYSPEGLKSALEAAAPGSSGVFEYLWMEDVLDKLLLLIFISFGSFVICDLEDDRMTAFVYSRSMSRSEQLLGRLTGSLASFLLVFMVGSLIVAAIGAVIVGELDAPVFVLHQIMVLPMCLFVFSLTFFLSVPLRTTAPTVMTSFGISLALSFAYSFLLMGGDTAPSELNPLALGYRILVGLPLEYAAGIALVISIVLIGGGFFWFTRKDI